MAWTIVVLMCCSYQMGRKRYMYIQNPEILFIFPVELWMLCSGKVLKHINEIVHVHKLYDHHALHHENAHWGLTPILEEFLCDWEWLFCNFRTSQMRHLKFLHLLLPLNSHIRSGQTFWVTTSMPCTWGTPYNPTWASGAAVLTRRFTKGILEKLLK